MIEESISLEGVKGISVRSVTVERKIESYPKVVLKMSNSVIMCQQLVHSKFYYSL